MKMKKYYPVLLERANDKCFTTLMIKVCKDAKAF